MGTSTYLFEGNAALVVPLQAAVVERDKHRFPPLFVRTLAMIVACYLGFGLLNWLAYGDSTEAVLTVNLPQGRWRSSVQLAYAVAVVLTFPLQLFPAIQTARSVLSKAARAVVAATSGSGGLSKGAVEKAARFSRSSSSRSGSSRNTQGRSSSGSSSSNNGDGNGVASSDIRGRSSTVGSQPLVANNRPPPLNERSPVLPPSPPSSKDGHSSSSSRRIVVGTSGTGGGGGGGGGHRKKAVAWQKRLLGMAGRALLVVVLCQVAIRERNSLTKILSLLGAFLGIPLAYVFPILIHLNVVPDSPALVKHANWAVVIFGLVLCFVCSAITLASWGS